MKILITGGAGFIGLHLSKKLSDQGHDIAILDNFSHQIHGVDGKSKLLLKKGITLIEGDVRDREVWRQNLPQYDTVVHLAAETGTGQSMYEVTRYESVNIAGTAFMFDCIVNDQLKNIKKIIVASSRSIYGEGAYSCSLHGTVYPEERLAEDMKTGYFEPRCPKCSNFTTMLATTESSPFKPTSFYGLTKQVQEQMVLMYARTLGISAYALRYQNVYGPGQSLANPYTGILAIFSNLARENKSINIFEDGRESRDFVYIDDVIEATAACINSVKHEIVALNVGSGVSTNVLDVAKTIVEYYGSSSPINVSGAFRLGDIRHNVADLNAIYSVLGYLPRYGFKEGVAAFLNWASQSSPQNSGYERSLEELKSKGLMHA